MYVCACVQGCTCASRQRPGTERHAQTHTSTHLAEHQHAMVADLASSQARCVSMARLRLLKHGVEVGIGILASIGLCGHALLS